MPTKPTTSRARAASPRLKEASAPSQLPLPELRDLYLRAKHAYYAGDPFMSDAEFDACEEELRQRSPDDPLLAIVGAPVSKSSMLMKVRHARPMGSLSKVNSEAEFRAWVEKAGGGAIHAGLKGDGASAAAYYRDGQLVQAISRGDGTVGEDITANAVRFKGLPSWAGDQGHGFNGAVRCEVILTLEDWAKVDPEKKTNPRNAGTGIMGRKNGHQANLLTTYAFDLDETVRGQLVAFPTERAKIERLENLGFTVIPHEDCRDAEAAVAWFGTVTKKRDSLPFWIDGIVLKLDDVARQAELGVTSGRPKGQIAWKFDSVGVETVLEGIAIAGGHTGALIPVAQLRPVDVGGTTVRHATLSNFDEIARLDLAISDSVWLVKANDIIPKIIRVTKRPARRQAITPPTACPFCGGDVARRRRTVGGDEGVVLECRNDECPKKSSGKIKRWIKSVEIEGIGESVLDAMIEQLDLADASELYGLRDRQAQLAELIINQEKRIRLGQKRAASIVAAIEAKRALSLGTFIGSLGIEHLGKRRVELMTTAADGALTTLDAWRSGRLREPEIAAAAGAPNIGSAMQDGIDAASDLIDRLLARGVTVQSASAAAARTAEPAKGRVCISGALPSGLRKADYTEPLRAAGYDLVDEVSQGLTFLVVADPSVATNKAQKARKLGIPVVTEAELRKTIGMK